MQNNLNKLTIVIVTYKTKKNIIEKCLSSIDKKIKIILIENSKKIEYSKYLEKKFKNIEIYYTKKNFGYGKANNYGIKKTKTPFVLISNPDVVFNKDFFIKINKYLNSNINFSIIGAQSRNRYNNFSAGFFNKKIKISNLNKYDEYNLHKVDWVKGFCMLINVNNFKSKKIFDENFFLFFEELDLCFRLQKEKKIVFTSKDLVVHHLGFGSSAIDHNKSNLNSEKLRNWHYMWSFFYFHKKNYGLLYACSISLNKLLKSIFKSFFYSIIFNSKRTIYLYRFLGLANSMLGRSSKFRIN